VKERLERMVNVVTRELNASTDNPLVFPQTQSIIHCGNFYGQQISMACDYLALGPGPRRPSWWNVNSSAW
jgi:histidine ammonia-lyase